MNTTVFPGEEKLRAGAGQMMPPTVRKITEAIYTFQYFGASNATLLIGEEGCVLIDAFDSDGYAKAALAEIANLTEKPIRTIIYTHTHMDHIGGAAVFGDTAARIIAHTSYYPVIGRQEAIAQVGQVRGAHQFGAKLTLEESISMGLSPAVVPNGVPRPLAATELISAPRQTLSLEGFTLECIAVPGETDDQMAVWLPEENILCCGDTYYASWPNLSALRGSTYRDIDQWVQSLSRLLALPAQVLIPGHGEILFGATKITDVLSNYHDAIDWVLTKTLDGINQGLSPDAIIDTVKLPEKWATLPYLQEYYGTVAWSVRGIYAGYLGWFDGNPTHIGTLPERTRAEKHVQLAGGADKVALAIQNALDTNDMQWALELCDMLLLSGQRTDEAKGWKATACTYLGRMQTSANGRHYYLSCAKDLQAGL